MKEVVAEARKGIGSFCAQAGSYFGGRIQGHLIVGPPKREILQLATDLLADVIVVGSHNRKGMERWLMGSVSEYVVRHACCSVIVARPKDYSSKAPEIEPPCPDCLTTQRESDGERLWCARHAKHRVQPHLHYETPARFGVGSSFLRPEG
jgi:hypothetical protein